VTPKLSIEPPRSLAGKEHIAGKTADTGLCRSVLTPFVNALEKTIPVRNTASWRASVFCCGEGMLPIKSG
jgi:hypothetical protein